MHQWSHVMHWWLYALVMYVMPGYGTVKAVESHNAIRL